MEKLEAILAAPSLYDEAIRLLGRKGFDIGDEAARSDSAPATSNPENHVCVSLPMKSSQIR
jgi:tryptophan 2,3-dioxygenase